VYSVGLAARKIINGVELGGGSIRIHDRAVQMRTFELLGFSKDEAEKQFGFLLGAFEFGAPPHGGLAFGLDRLCTVLGGQTSIRNYIAFPKNNMGRDMMIDSPSAITPAQLAELSIGLALSEKDLAAAAAATEAAAKPKAEEGAEKPKKEKKEKKAKEAAPAGAAEAATE
jgi:hypothetical protein